MDKESSTWHFDEAQLAIRNCMTGACIELRDLDTSGAVLAQVMRVGFSGARGNARDFTAALRDACEAVFHRSLRNVYCAAGRPVRVDWKKRRLLSRQPVNCALH